ncbi:MAG TPA: glycine cleavage T C-terminal barrel domain-containing protein [Verrucomicrobiae bacterium]|nr:glycine cleavage T C-terminal barrel domain-containing protein [Verrucomicrobiae bacterium]
MQPLPTHEAHQNLGAQFMELSGAEVVAQYGDVACEFAHLSSAAAVLDFSFRTRLVLIGADRARFLHSQCTNDINRLKPGEGCYTAFTTNKGRLLGDANVFVLSDEILLDAEPGQTTTVAERLKQFIVSEEVEIVDAAPHYGLLTVQGPKAAEVMAGLELGVPLPSTSLASVKIEHAVFGELYLSNHPRLRTAGADLFVPTASLGATLDKLITAAKSVGGGLAGWKAFDLARVEAGIPRFGVDMDETNLAPEACLEARAISYTKGCYVGQEILNRLRTFAEVNKRLCRLTLPDDLKVLPERGAKLVKDGKEIGYVTSAARIPGGAMCALGYVRKEWLDPGEVFALADGGGVKSSGPAI